MTTLSCEACFERAADRDGVCNVCHGLAEDSARQKQAEIDALTAKYGISDPAAAFYVGPMYGERFRDAVDVFCGEGAGRWLIDLIQGTPEEDCQDCYRLAIVGIETDEAFYQDRVSCCGSSDFTWTHEPSGIEFRFGYNFGH